MRTLSPPIRFNVSAASATTHLQDVVALTAVGGYGLMSVPSLAQRVSRLDPTYPAADYPDRSANSGAWIWGSRACWDPVRRRAIWICASHPPTDAQLDNGYSTLLTVWDEASNAIWIYEDPFGSRNLTYPRSVGHAFDNCAIRGRVLYKWTTPYYPAGATGYLQPQVCKINLDALTSSRASGQEGAAYLGSIAPPDNNITAGAFDYLPGADRFVLFHQKYLYFLDPVTETWSAPVDLSLAVGGFAGMNGFLPFHNLGSYNPNSGYFVCGGGAYNPTGAGNQRYQLDWVRVHGTTLELLKLDNSPVIMSVSETGMEDAAPFDVAKCAMCADPTSNRHLSFHDNLTTYSVDPTAAPGSQWAEIGTRTFEVDIVCSVPDRSSVLCFTGGAGGTAQMRAYKPAAAVTAGSYVATHYVAPYASVSGASNDYTDLGATAWTNAQNSGTPTTLGTAMARATTGNKVQCAAGVYTKPWPGGNQQTPGFYPTNTGSAQNPIVFFAQTPAATNRGTPAAWSELRWTGAPDYSAGATGQNASILGCRGATGGNYVVFDGFAARRSYVPPMGSYGAMCTSATGTKFRRIWYDYEGPTPPLGSETDNWCVFWIRGSTDCVIEDCYFTGNTGAGNHNCAAITSYDANNFTIRNNTFYRMQNGIFVKAGPNYGEIYFNRFDTHGLCWVTVQSSHASNPVRVHHNLVIEAGYFDVDSSGGPSNQVMSVYGNTIVGASGVRWQADMDAVPASGAMQWYDNLLADPSGTVDVHIGTQSGVSFATLYNRMTLLDFNVYSDSGGSMFSDTSNKNWTDYRNALSGLPVACRETSSLATVVTFAGANDYRLAANGQSALRASSTGGPVGCYVTGTEEIGIRQNPGY